MVRLIGRLWTLERMFYYIYGGWGQGLEMNDFPPSVKYLFSKQIVDELTHEMLYLDALIKRGPSPPKNRRSSNHTAASRWIRRWLITSFRCAISRPIRIRSASRRSISAQRSSNSRGWRSFRQQPPIPTSRPCSTARRSKTAATSIWAAASSRSSSAKPVEAELCRWACAVARRDYFRFLHELGDFVLDRSTPPPPLPRVQVTD